MTKAQFLGAGLAVLLASAAYAQDGPMTLPTGRYLCELPGDATGPASLKVEGAWFDIVNASAYVTEGGGGTYLLNGKTLVFTRGPLKGAKFERTGARALKRLEAEGQFAKLRCVRTGRAEG